MNLNFIIPKKIFCLKFKTTVENSTVEDFDIVRLSDDGIKLLGCSNSKYIDIEGNWAADYKNPKYHTCGKPFKNEDDFVKRTYEVTDSDKNQSFEFKEFDPKDTTVISKLNFISKELADLIKS